MPLGVKKDNMPSGSVVVSTPEGKEASDDRGTDAPVVPKVPPGVNGASVSVEEAAEVSVLPVALALALEVALRMEVVAETPLELKLALGNDDVTEENEGMAELVALKLKELKEAAED